MCLGQLLSVCPVLEISFQKLIKCKLEFASELIIIVVGTIAGKQISGSVCCNYL